MILLFYLFTIILNTQEYNSIQLNDIQLFSKSITYQTVSYDDTTKIDYTEFVKLHSYLKQSFPMVFSSLETEIINKYSLLLKWEGELKSKKPIIFLAHMDVVPVNEKTAEKWKFKPFSGKVYDGKIWGRGTFDNKIGLISNLIAIRELIKQGFKPKQDIYLFFGHDEELGGLKGSKKVVQFFKQKGIHFEAVLDEGGAILGKGIIDNIESEVAVIAVAEKGEVNIELEVERSNTHSHSSVPPKDTPVSILSEAIVRLNENPMEARLTPTVETFFENISHELSFIKKLAINNSWLFSPFLLSSLGSNNITNAFIRTTYAPTMISGSEKVNSIPEKATAKINFRILHGDNIKSVLRYVKNTINDDRVTISYTYGARNPSPVSSINSDFYTKLVETCKEIFPNSIYTPYLATGGTDSRHFFTISDNIYRFMAYRLSKTESLGPHGVNEYIEIKKFDDQVKFMIKLIKHF